MFTIITFMFCIYFAISNSIATESISNTTLLPSLTFYNNYIFSNELKLNVKQTNTNYTFGGYIKKNSINGNELFDTIDNRNYRVISTQTDNNNYFYNIFFTKKFKEFSKNNTNHTLYWTLFFNDSIKYKEVLEFTYVDVYSSAGLQIDYSINNTNTDTKNILEKLPINLFMSISQNINGVKNNIATGVSTFYTLNNNLSFNFEYSYFKDVKTKNKINKTYNNRHYIINVKDLLYESHNIKLITHLSFAETISADLLLNYSKTKSYGNNFYFGVQFKL